MRAVFHEQLDALLAQLSTLCHLAEVAMTVATDALLTADLTAAEQVVTDHTLLRELARRCEQQAVTLLALQAPVSRDLRTVVSTLRILDDLVRMGVLARHVALTARRWHPACAVPDDARDAVTAMGQLATTTATAAGELLLTRDPTQAEALTARTDTMATLTTGLTAALLHPDWAGGIPTAVELTLLTRWYDRYAAHIAKIARHVTYLSTGTLPAHHDTTAHEGPGPLSSRA